MTDHRPEVRELVLNAIKECPDVRVLSNASFDPTGLGTPVRGASLRSEIIKAVETALKRSAPPIEPVGMREALLAAIPLLWHDKVCDFASAFTKDCSCQYGKVLKQAHAALAAVEGKDDADRT